MPSIQIVLVEPSHPGNIGSTARAMKTMNLSQLALVNPKRFPDPQADWRAAGALPIVKNTRVYESIETAVSQSVVVAATSVRTRHISWPTYTSEEFAQEILSNYGATQQISILFGREDSGLTNEELQLCNVQVTIPGNPEYNSLNLAMAVQIIAYDLFKYSVLKDGSKKLGDVVEVVEQLATFTEVEAFYDHMWQVLQLIEFLDPDEPREAVVRLRRLFGRIRLDHTEVQILRGILSHFERALEYK
ncbi:MAG: RNA methyltransferase [Gammaproteobacteria bacterium]|nr:RNA methyltransferase [Gammaproteobacteria bacterium]MDE0251782.1 RNA methyltransferase [Gammaproteobacteria bacterium]MDE0403209.1 RNA methyltransferase [Gammaproteobacteria bacterium]